MLKKCDYNSIKVATYKGCMLKKKHFIPNFLVVTP